MPSLSSFRPGLLRLSVELWAPPNLPVGKDVPYTLWLGSYADSLLAVRLLMIGYVFLLCNVKKWEKKKRPLRMIL